MVIGYSRTGTSSITVAMTELGLQPYHMMNLMGREGHPAAFKKAIMTGNATDMINVVERDGFNVATEFSCLWREVYEARPSAKFILTTRDSMEGLSKSFTVMNRFTYYIITGPIGWFMYLTGSENADFMCGWTAYHCGPEGPRKECGYPRAYFDSGWTRDLDGEQCIANYQRHNEEIRATIPKDRLLEYNVKMGYQPLCDFLEVPPEKCPKTKFPHANDMGELYTMIDMAYNIKVAGCVALAVVLVLVAVFLRCCCCRPKRTSSSSKKRN